MDEALCQSATFSYDNVNQRVILTLCFERAGVYRAAVFYEDVLLLNGEFDCIVLTGDLCLMFDNFALVFYHVIS